MKVHATMAASATAKTNQSTVGSNGQVEKNLTVGQLVRATVLEIIADGDAVLLDIAGQVMRAKNQSSGELVPGKTIYVRIAERTPELITVKIEDEKAVVAERSIENALGKQLQRLGLDARPVLKNALRALHQQQVPITRHNVVTLRDDATSFRQIAAQLGGAAQTTQQDDQIVDWTKLSKALIVAAKTTLHKAADGTGERSAAPSASPNEPLPNGAEPLVNRPRAQVSPPRLGSSSETVVKAALPAEQNIAAPSAGTDKAVLATEQTAAVAPSAGAKTASPIEHNAAAPKGAIVKAEPGLGESLKAPVGADLNDSATVGQSDRQELPLRHLNAVLTNRMLAIDDRDDAQIMRLFAAMQKLNVPRTPLNTVLFDQLMQGKTDALSAVLDAIKPDRSAVSDKLATLLERFSASIIEYRALAREEIDGKALKKLAELSISLNKILVEASVRSETGQRADQVEVAKQNLNLLTDQVNWQAIHLPLRLREELRDVEVYVRGDAKKGGRFNPDNGLVYIALNTENLATVKVKLYFKGDQLSIVFLAQSDAYRDHLKRYDKELVDVVSSLIDKPVTVSYALAERDLNLSEMIKVADVQLSSFDQRV